MIAFLSQTMCPVILKDYLLIYDRNVFKNKSEVVKNKPLL